jgi:hypothetical protein
LLRRGSMVRAAVTKTWTPRMTIDTLEYVKRLEAAGVERRQAEAQAQAVRDALAPQLATKAELDAAVARLEAKMDAMRSQFENALWRHTAFVIVGVIAVAVLFRVLRFLR